MGDAVGQWWGCQKVWGHEERLVLKGAREGEKITLRGEEIIVKCISPKSLTPCIPNGFHLELELPVLL